VDKVREEFEKHYDTDYMIYDDRFDKYVINVKNGERVNDIKQLIDIMNILNYRWSTWCTSYKFRDKEIHRLGQIATENSDWFDALKIDFDKQKEEIKKLRNALEDIIAYTYPPRRDISGGCYYKAKRALEDVDG